MNRYSKDKKYEPFKIPDCLQTQGRSNAQTNTNKTDTQISLADGLFYEIDYDSCPIEGVGKFVLKSQKITPPEKDETRELFYRMRDIERQYRPPYRNYSRFYDKSVQQNNDKIFYKQAELMKDFEDDYPEQVPFSAYFPYYQMLGYEQLRTYFSWRTQVRKGFVSNTSLSYVFLYIYELLNNIGVNCPQDGLDKLVSFWTAYREYDASIDKYILRWLKDYHIYYDLSQTFKAFAEKHKLTTYYPKIADTEDSFDLFCSISKYDIRKSVFFTEETSKLITDCFLFLIEKIRSSFKAGGIQFEDAIFCPTKKIVPWKPFKDALFYPWKMQTDRRIVISENEIYMCSNNEWTFSTLITSEKGKGFIGYVMKQMESVLRTATKYKYKINASIDMLNQETLNDLKKSGLFIDKIVEDAVTEFYREETKTVVTVDYASLARIRREAQATQETLIVEEQASLDSGHASIILPLPEQSVVASPIVANSLPVLDSWQSMKDALSELELQALAIILHGDSSIKQFSDDNGIMLEVLADGINEKAMDYIGDNILDDELVIYEDYEEQVKGMIKLL